MDILDREGMSKIRSKNTKPELILRKALFAQGYRYRINDKKLPGKPDLVLPKYRTVIFMHGCYWHGHEGCKYFYIPKTNTEFWVNKISTNKERDSRNVEALLSAGWNVIIVWECMIAYTKEIGHVIGQIQKFLYSADTLCVNPQTLTIE